MIEMLNMDCMELMKKYPDKYFELAIIDPPYGIGADIAQNKAAEQRINAKGKSKAGRGWVKYKNTEWDNFAPTDEYFLELFRISKNQIIWGGNYFPYIWTVSNSFIIWNKMQREFSLADSELAWYSIPNKASRIFDFSRASALHENNKSGSRIHPTQKPVALYKWLLKNYAKQGDKILDTHGGSGSICIACHDMGFDLTWTELDEDYYKAAVDRFNNHTKQVELFEPEMIFNKNNDLF
ncbi:MAG: DNA methyltransferase [Spirochaetota bacterium]|nr:DNA methyltransferase [Spirochaetota bacterium]